MKIFCTIVLCVLTLSSCTRKELQNRQSTADTVKTGSRAERVSTDDSAGVTIHPSESSSGTGESTLTPVDTVAGEVYVAGNEPFTRVMLAISSTKSIDCEGDSAVLKTLRGIQGERVTIIGTMKKSVMGAAIVIKEFYRVR
jgi:hypothetical protein